MKVVKGIKKEQPDYAALHLQAAQRAGKGYLKTKSRDYILKAVNHGIRSIIALETKGCVPEVLENLCEATMGFIGLMTPRELMQVFPIEKTYDGERWGTKDYFYTYKKMDEHGLDCPFGSGDTRKLLWYYMNWTIADFQSAHICAMSDIVQKQTGKGLMEIFCEHNDVKPYTMHTDTITGKQYLYDGETGKLMRVKKSIPRYLKVVGGGGKK